MRWYRRRLLDELRSLLVDVASAWRSGRRPWLATAACLLTVAVSGAWHAPQGRDALVKVGDAYAAQPLKVEVVRLPASVFLPTFDLPWWGAVIQVAAVLGVAELLFGRRGLTVVGGLAQFASTMAARVMIIYGAAVHMGLPLSQAGMLDTGPSGITTAIGSWLLARRHAYATLALLMVGLTVAAVFQPNIDGREHEIAMLVGILAALVQRRLRPERDRGLGVRRDLGEARVTHDDLRGRRQAGPLVGVRPHDAHAEAGRTPAVEVTGTRRRPG
jgi:hypothetical protein